MQLSEYANNASLIPSLLPKRSSVISHDNRLSTKIAHQTLYSLNIPDWLCFPDCEPLPPFRIIFDDPSENMTGFTSVMPNQPEGERQNSPLSYLMECG